MRSLGIVAGVANHEHLTGLKAQNFACFDQGQWVGLFPLKGVAAKNHLKELAQALLLQELLGQVARLVGEACHWHV